MCAGSRVNWYSMCNWTLAAVIETFLFLRYGEFAILNKFEPEYNLCLNDIQITDKCVFMTYLRQGTIISLYITRYAICPILAVARYFKLRQSFKICRHRATLHLLMKLDLRFM